MKKLFEVRRMSESSAPVVAENEIEARVIARRHAMEMEKYWQYDAVYSVEECVNPCWEPDELILDGSMTLQEAQDAILFEQGRQYEAEAKAEHFSGWEAA